MRSLWRQMCDSGIAVKLAPLSGLVSFLPWLPVRLQALKLFTIAAWQGLLGPFRGRVGTGCELWPSISWLSGSQREALGKKSSEESKLGK